MKSLNPAAPDWIPPTFSGRCSQSEGSISGYRRPFSNNNRRKHRTLKLSSTDPSMHPKSRSDVRHPQPVKRSVSDDIEIGWKSETCPSDTPASPSSSSSFDTNEEPNLQHSDIYDPTEYTRADVEREPAETTDVEITIERLAGRILQSNLLIGLRKYGVRLTGGIVERICRSSLNSDDPISVWNYVERFGVDLQFEIDTRADVTNHLQSMTDCQIVQQLLDRMTVKIMGLLELRIFFSNVANWPQYTYFTVDALTIDAHGRLENPLSASTYTSRISSYPIEFGAKITHSTGEIVKDIIERRIIVILPLPEEYQMGSLIERGMCLCELGFSPTRYAARLLHRCYRLSCKYSVATKNESIQQYIRKCWNSKIYKLLSYHTLSEWEFKALSDVDKRIYIKFHVFNHSSAIAKWISQDHMLSMNALCWSANVGYIKMIRILITEYGIEMTKSEINYLLLIALYHNHINIATYLIQCGASLTYDELEMIPMSIYQNLFGDVKGNGYYVNNLDESQYAVGYESIVCGHVRLNYDSPCASGNYRITVQRLRTLYDTIISVKYNGYSYV